MPREDYSWLVAGHHVGVATKSVHLRVDATVGNAKAEMREIRLASISFSLLRGKQEIF